MENEKNVLCAANSYIEKFYLNEEFRKLPEEVQKTLRILCVEYTEEVGGILLLRFDEEGHLQLETITEDGDYLYDEIGAELKIRSIEKRYGELFEKLELYYEGLQSIRRAERASRKTLRQGEGV